jgi:uracil-DNA glycosylase
MFENVTPEVLGEEWYEYLGRELKKPYMLQLAQFLAEEKANAKRIYPQEGDIFNAFKYTHLERVKVVILGQDPYHGEGQAHGLAFSVGSGVKIPPSLVNIFKELSRDISIDMPTSGCLQSWAKQGVLLLNTTLSVEEGKAGSHQGKGWEQFTDKAISVVSEQCLGVVFMLWGAAAKKKVTLINASKHLILLAPHPSPLSVYRGYYGCNHFSKANAYLAKNQKITISWVL